MITIKDDSRKVLPGDTFVCIKGDRSDGHEYAETASKVGKGILGDIMIDANDHVLLYELNEGNAEAYMPYLYVAENSNDATVFNAVAKGTITKTPEVGPEEAPAEYMTNNRTDAREEYINHNLNAVDINLQGMKVVMDSGALVGAIALMSTKMLLSRLLLVV